MISKSDKEFFKKVENILTEYDNINELNNYLKRKTGILNFFKNHDDRKDFQEYMKKLNGIRKKEEDLGDFQTPLRLTEKICNYFLNIGFIPEAILEPTCGTGNFILSVIKHFPSIKYIYCVEIQPNYEWLFKLNVLKLSFQQHLNPIIEFHRDNIFTHNFSNIFLKFLHKNKKKFLILGNPPWITNTELSNLDSNNLPDKSNIKKVKGIEAITGSSNFDITEFIISKIIQKFSFREGIIAILCKTTVIKNLVRDMDKLGLKLDDIQSLIINSKKEFNIAADSALFFAKFGSSKSNFCTVTSLYETNNIIKKFGWFKNKFVSNIDIYKKYNDLDGKSIFEWRQGVKHDAVNVMVLKLNEDGSYINGFNETIDIEDNLLYPFIKGADLRNLITKDTLNWIIIPQTSLNQDTSYIEKKYPKIWDYLNLHSEKLDGRKSKIYQNKHKFSIFGIGEYSFKPYKIGIAGFYKSPVFSLLCPINDKPVMVDDTSYQISFNDFNTTFFTWIILNLDAVKNFLSSIVFIDSKRPFTKKVLMRIDILKLIQKLSFKKIKSFYERNLRISFKYDFNDENFQNYLESLIEKY